MFKFIFISLLIGSTSYGKNSPATVTLPPEAHQTLTKWNSKFKAFNDKDYSQAILDLFEKNEHPSILSADLNNDKIDDFVVLGQDNKKQFVIALINEKNKWIAVEVTSWSEKNISKTEITNPTTNKKEITVPIYISIAKDGLAEKIKPNKAIQVERYLAQPELFEIKNNKAIELTL